MWCNIIFILVLFIVAFIGFTGYTLAKDNKLTLDQVSRSEYTNKLVQLSPTDIWNEPVSAMCYDVAAPPDRSQYICPVCGEVTLYSSFFDSTIDLGMLSYYRNRVKKITKIDVELDESQLCEKCNPNAESRELCLIVKYDKKSKPQKTCNINGEDINLLYEYSKGLTEHNSSSGKVPIINYKDRLEKLLGRSINNIK